MNTKSRTVFFMFLFAGTLLVFYTKISFAVQSITTPLANQSSLIEGQNITLKISANVAQDTGLIKSSVVLIQTNSQGAAIKSYSLYDDHTHGDAAANDNIFTADISLDSVGAGSLNFIASASYTNYPIRIKSSVLSIPVIAAEDDSLDLYMSAILPALTKQSGSTGSSGSQVTLTQLANSAGVSLDEINHIHLTHYTDVITTLPQLKTDCITTASAFGVKWCTGWATYQKTMECEWFLDVPVSDNIDIFVTQQQSIDNVGKILTHGIKDIIINHVKIALAYSGVTSAISGFFSGGTAAAPAFVTAFGFASTYEMGVAAVEMANYIQYAIEGVNLVSSAFPAFGAQQIRESCGWSEWKRV
jgi:hypothetical protein